MSAAYFGSMSREYQNRSREYLLTPVAKVVGTGYTFLTRRGASVQKFSFAVDVEAYDVKLDPNEHAAFLWVTEDEARAKKCGDVDLVYTSKPQEDAILQSFGMERKRAEA